MAESLPGRHGLILLIPLMILELHPGNVCRTKKICHVQRQKIMFAQSLQLPRQFKREKSSKGLQAIEPDSRHWLVLTEREVPAYHGNMWRPWERPLPPTRPLV